MTMSKINFTLPGNILFIAIVLFTSNTLFSQWQPVGTVSNLGSWPSVFVYDENVIFVAGGVTGLTGELTFHNYKRMDYRVLIQIAS